MRKHHEIKFFVYSSEDKIHKGNTIFIVQNSTPKSAMHFFEILAKLMTRVHKSKRRCTYK